MMSSSPLAKNASPLLSAIVGQRSVQRPFLMNIPLVMAGNVLVTSKTQLAGVGKSP